MAIEGSCHCGAVRFRLNETPAKLTLCNCSICRRIAAKWAHAPEGVIEIFAAPTDLNSYSWGDHGLEFVRCAHCGCTTHWRGLRDDSPVNMAVNCNMADPTDLIGIRQRHFDGADSWTFLD